MTWLGYTEPTLADELAACRRTARDCQLVLAQLAGVPLAPHEVAEVPEARQRIVASVGGRMKAKRLICPPPALLSARSMA